MADYEDQNSSEYKDMNQETQAADQNPQNGQPFRGTAAAGIILGVIAILLGIGEFFYVLTITNLMKDPANAAAFNEFFEQFQRQLGIN